jgi:serine O-acetyltransferase
MSLRAKLALDAARWGFDWGRPRTYPRLLKLLLFQPGFQIVLALRLEAWVARAPLIGRLLRRMIAYRVMIRFGCDIDPCARIGGGVYFPHPVGIVIGGACVVGDNVWILQNVTLGRRGDGSTEGPTIGEGGILNAGAVLIGPVVVGAGAMIGANAVVLNDIPAGRTAVGVPARLLPPEGQG